jgi:hypothetical protein
MRRAARCHSNWRAWGRASRRAADATSFGTAIRTEYTSFAGNNDTGVDAIRMTLRYCP